VKRTLQFKLRVKVRPPGTKGRATLPKSTKGTETNLKIDYLLFCNPFSGFKPLSPAFSAGQAYSRKIKSAFPERCLSQEIHFRARLPDHNPDL
jgi:hypothetical protein